MKKKTTSYQKDLIEALKDPREAATYLTAAMEEGDRELFQNTPGDVVVEIAWLYLTPSQCFFLQALPYCLFSPAS